MAWKVRGKIAAHFPDRGVANLDVEQIGFIPAGSSQSAGDVMNVIRAYYVPKGMDPSLMTAANLNKFVVWERVREETLVAGSDDVSFQYTPSVDTQVHHIGIFTTDQPSSVHVKIIHESGLIVAAVDTDASEAATKHGLTGYIRTAAINQITLFAGQTYYIVYSFPHQAYYQGETGNYKIYNNSKSASEVTVRTMGTGQGEWNPAKYRGHLTSTAGIWSFAEDDYFAWVGDYSHGLNYGCLYVRSSVGTNNTFMGIIGDDSTYHTITTADLQRFLNLPYIPNKPASFIWYVDNFPGLTKRNVYAKDVMDTSSFDLLDFSQYSSEHEKFAALLIELGISQRGVMGSDGQLNYDSAIGKTYSLKTGYSTQITSMTPLTSLPADPVSGGLYYLDSSIQQQGIYNTGVWVYENSTYTILHNQNFDNYFDTETLDGLMTLVGSDTDCIKEEINQGFGNFFSNTLYTDKKFYLEINGNEVL